MINPNSKDYITNATKEDFWECFKEGYMMDVGWDFEEEDEDKVREEFERWFERYMRVKLSPMVEC